MQKFTIELDEMICKWLEHIAEITGKPIEVVIADGIYNKVADVEDSVYQSFTYSKLREYKKPGVEARLFTYFDYKSYARILLYD